ncbi:MAG: hypothetical protein RLZZ450_6549 [Pseudomonadota bacterium]|jgi:hypothetical protein
MLLRLTHRFEAPVCAVIDALAGSAYAAHLADAHSFFAEIDVLSRVDYGNVVVRSVRYRARPFIARLGVFSLPAEWFVWVEQSTFDRGAGILHFENVPELSSVQTKVVNRGTMTFRGEQRADGSWLTTREAHFEIDLHVAPLYRPLAELALSMIRRKLESSLDEEACLLAAWLERCAGVESVAA